MNDLDDPRRIPNRVFALLRVEWIRQGGDEQRTYTELAALLGVHPVVVTLWATDRRPPWDVIRRLLAETGSRVVISAHGITLLVETTDEQR
jgi:hypothetical protein